MNLTVRLLGQARQFAPGGHLTIEAPDDASVDQVLPAILAAAESGLESVLATPEGSLRPGVMAVLREETIDPSAPGLLGDQDELSLLPPMSGG